MSRRLMIEHEPDCPQYGHTRRWAGRCVFCLVSEASAKREKAKHVNDDCVWGEGECIPDCPSCKRMDELIAEREKGDIEGQRDALAKAVSAVATFHKGSCRRYYAEDVCTCGLEAAIKAVSHE